ncbi:MAG: HAD-IIA family hydrolase [Methanosarcinales archaeon]|nr:MAG: HAD-IIA family hydrolase [Methanosarcinales archaeon]
MKAYILDIDGVIYRGNNLIDGAVGAVNRLQDHSKVLFLTNNSTRSRASVATRLKTAGIPCEADDVITAGYATAVYIRKHHGASTVYPIGEAGLIKELQAAGHKISEDARFVVVGLDRDFNYKKLRIGLQNITNDAKFIATNTDPVLPTENGFVPGAGAIVSALKTASGKSPLVIGKPNQPIMDIVIDHIGLNANKCTVVGDRLDTDIFAGTRCGMKTALVLTGVETLDSLKRSDIKPDIVIESIKELLAASKGDE